VSWKPPWENLHTDGHYHESQLDRKPTPPSVAKIDFGHQIAMEYVWYKTSEIPMP